jgi:hypothetical protein
LVGEEVDYIESVFYDADCEDLFAVVATLHHEGVC